LFYHEKQHVSRHALRHRAPSLKL